MAHWHSGLAFGNTGRMVEVWHQRHLKTKQVIQEYEYHILNVAVTKSTKSCLRPINALVIHIQYPNGGLVFHPLHVPWYGEASRAMDGCLGGQLFLPVVVLFKTHPKKNLKSGQFYCRILSINNLQNYTDER